MHRSWPLKTVLALALALQFTSQASACRIGYDQHLFEDTPPANALPGAQVIRVHFSTAGPAMDSWPRWAPNRDGTTLGYALIGVARRFGPGASDADGFPVYAIVTSCSGFWAMSRGGERVAVEGDYYLVGRFASDESGTRFYAGGRRVANGQDIYGGWHF